MGANEPQYLLPALLEPQTIAQRTTMAFTNTILAGKHPRNKKRTTPLQQTALDMASEDCIYVMTL